MILSSGSSSSSCPAGEFSFQGICQSIQQTSCGGANGLSLANAPTANLCSNGTASPVTGTGPWSWSCASASGGASATCSAQLAKPSSGRTADFLNMIGINTHLDQTGTPYQSNPSMVINDLNYLGVKYIRTGLSAPLTSGTGDFIAVAQAGIKFDVGLPAGGNDISLLMSQADNLLALVPGSIASIEGANEINNWPVTYNGVGGLQGAIDLQQALYSAVHSDPNMVGVPVYYFTNYNPQYTADGPGPNPAATPGLADYDNAHPYPPNTGEAPRTPMNPADPGALANELAPFGPAVYTECGYSVNSTGQNDGLSNSNPPDIQAKLTLDMIMDGAFYGLYHIYIYQLMDQATDIGYGVFDINNNPREVATGIHNLTTILADSGSGAATFTPKLPTYSLNNLPSTGNSMVMQKSTGTSEIVVWNEPTLWDFTSSSEVTASTASVTVKFGSTQSSVKVYDTLQSSSPIQTYSSVSSVVVQVTDHPIIIELTQ